VTSAIAWTLGALWGALVVTPVVRQAMRVAAATRAATLSPGRMRKSVPWFAFRHRRVSSAVERSAVGRVWGAVAGRRRARADDAALARELPVTLDLLGVAVGAGCTPHLALDVAARWSPPHLADAFGEVLRRCALGLDLESSLDAMATTTPRLRPLADALLTSDRAGAPIGPVLARLADENRAAVRRSAETHARRVPVRLLFPLVFLVLPAFVLLTVVPGIAAGLGRL
jgi:hypothetical protein